MAVRTWLFIGTIVVAALIVWVATQQGWAPWSPRPAPPVQEAVVPTATAAPPSSAPAPAPPKQVVQTTAGATTTVASITRVTTTRWDYECRLDTLEKPECEWFLKETKTETKVGKPEVSVPYTAVVAAVVPTATVSVAVPVTPTAPTTPTVAAEPAPYTAPAAPAPPKRVVYPVPVPRCDPETYPQRLDGSVWLVTRHADCSYSKVPAEAPAYVPPSAPAEPQPAPTPQGLPAYGQPPQPQIGHPALYVETGIRKTRNWTLPVDPDKVLVVGGFRINGRGDGVYRAYGGGQTVTVLVTDGFAAIVKAEWAYREFCFRVGQARQYGWAHSTIEPLPGWPAC